MGDERTDSDSFYPASSGSDSEDFDISQVFETDQTNMSDEIAEVKPLTVNGFVNRDSTCYVHSFLGMCGHVTPIRDEIMSWKFDGYNFMSTLLKLFQATIRESVNPFREQSKGIDIELLLRACGYPRRDEDVLEVSLINIVSMNII